MPGILHVITGLGAGGAETMLAQLATGLQARGLPQYVVSLKGRGVHADALEAAAVPVKALGVSSLINAPLAKFRLARLMRAVRPDIVQGWMYHGNLAATAAHCLCPGRANRRLYWNIRASNMDDKRYRSIINWNARLSAWPDLVVVNSVAGRDFHLARGFHPRRMEVVPNGIDTEKFKPDANVRAEVRKELGIAEDAVVAIHVARVDPMKDHATFLSAMAELPHIKGVLVGTQTKQLALPENVRALGLRDDVTRLHQAADIFVSSSAFGEGFSNAIAEGMASGLVAVVTDVGDARLIVGSTGQVVPPRTPDALRNAIREQANLGSAGLRKHGLEARARIVERFTLTQIIDAYARIYTADTTESYD